MEPEPAADSVRMRPATPGVPITNDWQRTIDDALKSELLDFLQPIDLKNGQCPAWSMPGSDSRSQARRQKDALLRLADHQYDLYYDSDETDEAEDSTAHSNLAACSAFEPSEIGYSNSRQVSDASSLSLASTLEVASSPVTPVTLATDNKPHPCALYLESDNCPQELNYENPTNTGATHFPESLTQDDSDAVSKPATCSGNLSSGKNAAQDDTCPAPTVAHIESTRRLAPRLIPISPLRIFGPKNFVGHRCTGSIDSTARAQSHDCSRHRNLSVPGTSEDKTCQEGDSPAAGAQLVVKSGDARQNTCTGQKRRRSVSDYRNEAEEGNNVVPEPSCSRKSTLTRVQDDASPIGDSDPMATHELGQEPKRRSQQQDSQVRCCEADTVTTVCKGLQNIRLDTNRPFKYARRDSPPRLSLPRMSKLYIDHPIFAELFEQKQNSSPSKRLKPTPANVTTTTTSPFCRRQVFPPKNIIVEPKPRPKVSFLLDNDFGKAFSRSTGLGLNHHQVGPGPH